MHKQDIVIGRDRSLDAPEFQFALRGDFGLVYGEAEAGGVGDGYYAVERGERGFEEELVDGVPLD